MITKGFKLYFFNKLDTISTVQTGDYNMAAVDSWTLLSHYDNLTSITNTFDETLNEEENSRYTLEFKIAKRTDWIGSLPVDFDFSKFIRIGRKLKLELVGPNRTLFLIVTSISPEGYGENIIFNVTAVDFGSYVFAKNNVELTLNTRTDEDFLEWLETKYSTNISTAGKIIEYILTLGRLYSPELDRGWKVIPYDTNDSDHPLNQNIGIELSSSNTYNALVEVALGTNSFLVIDFMTRRIGLIKKNHASFKKNYILSPEFNLQDLSLTYNSEAFYPILFGIGGEDDRGLTVGLIPYLTPSQFRSLRPTLDINFDYTNLENYYQNPNFYENVIWQGEIPSEENLNLINRIPYLDTFILDLTYFIEQNLIVQEDYEYILDKIFNDLRRINIEFQRIFNIKASLERQIMIIEEAIDNETTVVNAGENLGYNYDNEKLDNLYSQEGGGMLPSVARTEEKIGIKSPNINFENNTLQDIMANGYLFYEVTKDAYENYFTVPVVDGGAGFTEWAPGTSLSANKYHVYNSSKYYVSAPYNQIYPLELSFVVNGVTYVNRFTAPNTWSELKRDVQNYDFVPYTSSPNLYQFRTNMEAGKDDLSEDPTKLFVVSEPTRVENRRPGSLEPLQLYSFTDSNALNFTSGTACVMVSPSWPTAAPINTLVYNFYNNRVYRYKGYGAGGCSVPYSSWEHVGLLNANISPFQKDSLYALESNPTTPLLWESSSTTIGYLKNIGNVYNTFMKKSTTSRDTRVDLEYDDPYGDDRIENSGIINNGGTGSNLVYKENLLYMTLHLESDPLDYLTIAFRLKNLTTNPQFKQYSQLLFPDGHKNWVMFGNGISRVPNESTLWTKLNNLSDTGAITTTIASNKTIGENYTIECSFKHPKIHLGYRVGGKIRFVHPLKPHVYYEGLLRSDLNPNLHYFVNPNANSFDLFDSDNLGKTIYSSNITIEITKISNMDEFSTGGGWRVVAPFFENDHYLNLATTAYTGMTVKKMYWFQTTPFYLTSVSAPFTFSMDKATVSYSTNESNTIYSLHKYFDLLTIYKGLNYTSQIKLNQLKNTYIENIQIKNDILTEIAAQGSDTPEELSGLQADLAAYRTQVGNSEYDVGTKTFYEEGYGITTLPSQPGELGLKYLNYKKFLDIYLSSTSYTEDSPSIYPLYKKLQSDKQKIWFDLKEKFGDILTEGYYENTVENDSYSLFIQTLENSKDFFKPAEDYSLTYLDGSQIVGKDIDLIQVGDFIQIRGEKLGILSNEVNEVQVSSVSRDLRDFSNINIAVNKIKTHHSIIEKLLSSVAKK